MKVGSKFYTKDGMDIFYPNRIIEITKITGKRVEYTYLTTHGIFYRSVDNFAISNLQEISPVMELFYE
jgi:hypothetical protein